MIAASFTPRNDDASWLALHGQNKCAHAARGRLDGASAAIYLSAFSAQIEECAVWQRGSGSI